MIHSLLMEGKYEVKRKKGIEDELITLKLFLDVWSKIKGQRNVQECENCELLVQTVDNRTKWLNSVNFPNLHCGNHTFQ